MDTGNKKETSFAAAENRVTPDVQEKVSYEPLRDKRSIRLVKLQLMTAKAGVVLADGYGSDDVIIIEGEQELARTVEEKGWSSIKVQPKVETFNLDECPPYYALSYTWGDPIRRDLPEDGPRAVAMTRNLVKWNFGTGFFDIPYNLRSAIDMLAVSPVYRGNYFWMDAVCINQEDPAEKASQVSLMSEFFSRAEGVIVWLGNDTTLFADFEWMYSDFLQALNRYGVTYGFENLEAQHPYDQRFQIRLGVVPRAGAWTHAWARFFEFCRRHSWFSRAWCVQEITLARRAIVHCGIRGVDWGCIELFAQILQNTGWYRSARSVVQRTMDIEAGEETIRMSRIRMDLRAYLDLQAQLGERVPVDPNVEVRLRVPSFLSRLITTSGSVSMSSFITSIANTALGWLASLVFESRDNMMGDRVMTTNRGLVEGDEPPLTWYVYFQHILYCTRPYLSEDPRDKIYAFLGIAQKALPPGRTMPVVPDYTSGSSPEGLYIGIAKLLLTRLMHLEHLSHVEDKARRNVTSLPSWVPDYSCTEMPRLLTSNDSFSCCPRASGPAWVMISSENELTTLGGQFDRIVAVARPVADSLRMFDVSTWLAIYADLAPVAYPATGEDLSEVFWRTLLANTLGREPPPSTMRPAFKAWICAHLSCTAQVMRQRGANWDEVWAIIAWLLRVFEACRDELGSAALAEVETADRRQAMLLPYWRDKYAEERAAAEKACAESEHVYAMPTLMEVRRMHYCTYESKQARQMSKGEISMLWDTEMLAEFENSGLPGSFMFTMGTSETTMAVGEQASLPFEDALQDVAQFRTLYRTEKGYVGLGPRSTQVGDEVWLLQGAKVPFVLREKEDKHEGRGRTAHALIGETYLHGFMEGRMARDLGWKAYSIVTLA